MIRATYGKNSCHYVGLPIRNYKSAFKLESNKELVESLSYDKDSIERPNKSSHSSTARHVYIQMLYRKQLREIALLPMLVNVCRVQFVVAVLMSHNYHQVFQCRKELFLLVSSQEKGNYCTK